MPKPIGNIEHVIVLMMENRSFDHIFGFRAGVNGLLGNEYNLLDPSKPPSNTNREYFVSNGAPYAVLAGQGPAHSVHATNYQLCNNVEGPGPKRRATNNGFVRNYADALHNDRVPNPGPEVIQVVMDAFAPARLPSINALADAFCLCDNWHAEVPGPTQPNRLYMHAATSAGLAHNVWTDVFDLTTIYNHLEDAGFTWAVYSFDRNDLRAFSKINTRNENFKQFQDSFRADVQAGALADYVFIEPRFLNSKNSGHATGGLANSQHPPEDARYGDNLIADVYEALRSNPHLWAKSALIVTYDEHGGFYDHVVPPSHGIPNPDGLTSPTPKDPSWAPTFKFNRLGLRVPAVIASPWVRAGRIDSTRYQHTSVLATLKKIFGLPSSLTKRDAAAHTFDGLFAELNAPRTDTPATLPRAPLPAVSVSTDDPRHPANQPLDEDQRDLLLAVYHLTRTSHPEGPSPAALPRTQGEAHDFIQARYRKHFGPPAASGAKPHGRRIRR